LLGLVPVTAHLAVGALLLGNLLLLWLAARTTRAEPARAAGFAELAEVRP
jgi:hypothetical protein